MDLTQGSIRKQLFHFALPILGMMILNQAYVVVDNAMVARFAGDHALAIISATSAVLSIGYCILNGCSYSVTVLVGRFFGAKNGQKIKSSIYTVTIAGIGIAVILALVYFLGAESILRSVETPDGIMKESVLLLRIYAISFLVQLIAQIVMSVLNGMGDSRNPLKVSLVTQLLNIILDYVFIAVFQWGYVGAAGASIFCLVISMVWSLIIMTRSLKEYQGIKGEWDTELFELYLKVSIPSMIQQTIMSAGALFLQRLVNQVSIDAINGYAIANNLHNLMIIPAIAYTDSYQTFASQNYGANKESRVRAGYRELLLQGSMVMAVMITINILGNKSLVSIYLSDPGQESFRIAQEYLLALTPRFVLMVPLYGIMALFKAQLKVYYSTVVSFIQLFSQIILAYVLVPVHGLLSIAASSDIGTLLALLAATIMIRSTFPKKDKKA